MAPNERFVLKKERSAGTKYQNLRAAGAIGRARPRPRLRVKYGAGMLRFAGQGAYTELQGSWAGA